MLYAILVVCLIFLFVFIVYAEYQLQKALRLNEQAVKSAQELEKSSFMYASHYYYLRNYIKSAQVDNTYWREQLDKAVERCEADIRKSQEVTTDDHHEWSSCAWCGDKNAEHINGRCQTCVKRDKECKHMYEPTDTQGYDMECSVCGKLWRLY